MAQPKALVGPGDIIADAWLNFRTNVAVYAEFVVWFVLLRVIQWAITALVTDYIDDRYLRLTIQVICLLPVLFMYSVLTVGLIDAVARHLRGKKSGVSEALSAGFHRIFPLLWGWILSGGIILLGFVAFVVPGIMFIIWYRFVQDFVVVDGLHGRAALGASRDLVSGRFWAVFARILVPGIFYYVAVLFVSYVANMLAGAVLGDPGLFFAHIGSVQSLPNTYVLLGTVIDALIKGFALPLFLGAELILWLDLKRTA